MTVTPIKAFVDNYIWAIKFDKNSVWVVDAGDAEPVEAYLSKMQLELKGILITHHHGDHTGGVEALVKKRDIPVYGPKDSPFSGISHPLSEGDILSLHPAGASFEVLCIPGHTLDHVAYFGGGALFCGDTLFAGGCGRVFEGSMSQMYQSLMKLRALPPETRVYCAHEYTLANLKFAKMIEPENVNLIKRIDSTAALRASGCPSLPSQLKEECLTNPFLRCEVDEVRLAAAQRAGKACASSEEVFACIRRWKDEG